MNKLYFSEKTEYKYINEVVIQCKDRFNCCRKCINEFDIFIPCKSNNTMNPIGVIIINGSDLIHNWQKKKQINRLMESTKKYKDTIDIYVIVHLSSIFEQKKAMIEFQQKLLYVNFK